MIETVGIIGRGALGVMYYLALEKALGRGKVLLIADKARLERYRKGRLYCNGRLLKPEYRGPEEAGTVDLLIFTVKFTGLSEAIETVRGCVGERTVVMSFLNGVTSEGIIAGRLGVSRLLYTTVQGMDATFADGRLTYSHQGSITFGVPGGGTSADIQAVAALFDAAGLKYQVSADIEHQLWSKWMLNVGVNQACAAYKVGYGGAQRPGEVRDAMYRAMREAQACAGAAGVILTDREMENWVALMDSLDPEGAPSMEQDRRAGRPTEVGLFAGTVLELGKKYGVDTPQNRLFAGMLK